MPPKRPIRNVFDNDDDDPTARDNTQNGTPPKKPRPDSSRSTIHRVGVPPPTSTSAATVAQNGGANSSIQAQVAAAKARAQALMSAMQQKGTAVGGASAGGAPARPPPPAAPSTIGGARNGAPPTSTPASSSTATRLPAAASGPSSIQAQLEAARAKVQAQMAALNNRNKPSPIPSSSTTPSQPSTGTATPATPSISTSKAPTGIHPLLLSNDLPYKPKSDTLASSSAPSTSYVKGRTNHIPPESNPYLQASRELSTSTAEGPKQRSMHKGFQFHKPGRHVREAEELRREQQMEELKRRIEQSARKAGLSDELGGGDEKRLVREPPPEVEWWDVNLLSSRSYDDVDELISPESMLESAKEKKEGGVLLYGTDSPIDKYVQHPIPIPAPSDNIEVRPRGLMLTKREQRKLRRQRRAAEQSDKRDRIKMGLLPPEPPKVKLSNLMRVLTSEAVSDPTKIEARVRREIAARKEAHERQNAERKLTDEQRREKIEKKKENDASKGLYCQVYKIKHLISPRHKFKVRRNAQDHAMTGVCIFHPAMALVVVEGSGKACKAYKRLLTLRMDWKDPGEPKQDENSDAEEGQKEEAGNANNVPLGGFRTLTTSQEDEVDWSTNSCELIFEGPIRERYWEGRGFRAIAAPTDQSAREVLGSAMQGYWDVAKRAAQSSVDTF
ncbi:related to PRP3 - essential splicing factor [Ustilago trichophora]|uniref:Related to PRP3 - essential splicing factor n=1 Tax=Ustilago trichophora TaxID=86804 RepID=A0A5C3EG34_9BASI|nr:related to PRP3 - essential splicing factor [Ustilago trichophora]